MKRVYHVITEDMTVTFLTDEARWAYIHDEEGMSEADFIASQSWVTLEEYTRLEAWQNG